MGVIEDNVARYWAPKVRAQSIRRLYETNVMGIVDEDLINDVGFALFARCQTIRIVTERRCPECEERLPFDGKTIGAKRNEPVACVKCGWTTTWSYYHRSYKGQRIHGGRAYPAFLQFIHDFETKSTPRHRMVAIDRLIHAVHEEARNAAATPGSVNLIQGNMQDVLRLLEELAYGGSGSASSGVRNEYVTKMENAQIAREKHQRVVKKRRRRRSTK